MQGQLPHRFQNEAPRLPFDYRLCDFLGYFPVS